MFWHSLIDGFNVVCHWQTWVFALIVSSISYGISYAIMGRSVNLTASERYADVSRIKFFFLSSVDSVLSIAMLISLSNIFYGDNSIEFHNPSFNHIVNFLIISTLIAFVVFWLRILTSIYENPTITLFIEGIIVLRIMIWALEITAGRNFPTPSLWYIIVYGGIALLLDSLSICICIFIVDGIDWLYRRLFVYKWMMTRLKRGTSLVMSTHWSNAIPNSIRSKISAFIPLAMYTHYFIALAQSRAH